MSSRAFLPALLLVFAAILPGCPTPDEATTANAPPGGPPPGAEGITPPGPPADGAVLPPPTDGAPPAEGTAGSPVGASPEGGSMINLEDLKFSRFITADQKTVNLTVKVEGGTAGQVDIVSLSKVDGKSVPTVLHIEAFSGSTPLVIAAPANYADPLYISAVVRVEKSGTDAAPPSGALTIDPKSVGGVAEPIKLGDKDVEVTVKLGTTTPWLEGLAAQTAASPPPPGGPPPGPPPGGGPE